MLLFRCEVSFTKLTVLTLFIILSCTLASGLRKHKRHCCKYSFEEKDSNNLCENSSACIFEHSRQLPDNLTTAPLHSCRVLGDSKRDISTLESRQKCLEHNFVVEQKSSTIENYNMTGMFELRRYIMESDLPQNEFGSIEVILPASRDWYSVKFRFFDLSLCPNDEMSENCAPRCVDIEKRESKKNFNANKNIVYDCEGGFYVSDTQSKSVRSTADDLYQFDICFDSIKDGKVCRSYLFEMGGQQEDVILVEQTPLVEKKQIVLHMSDRMSRYLLAENVTSKLEIYRISDYQNPKNGNNEFVQVHIWEHSHII